jgi:hypothetical protein
MFSPAGPVKAELTPDQGLFHPAYQASLGGTVKSGYTGFDNHYSNNSDASSDSGGAKYPIKTMCLAKKTVRMPTKKEHGFLLFCGLGARKWQCSMDCNSLTFKQAILNIYPRLRSVIGYNLFTLASDKKTFERIPEKINTPMRMRVYLGASFTGCLVIVPVSDIVLMEERREHIRQQDIEDSKPASTHTAMPQGLYYQKQEEPTVFLQQEELAACRSLCLICGKIEKTPGAGIFHNIMEEPLPGASDPRQVIAKKLTDILGFNFEQSRKKLIASNEICRKCLRTVCDLVRKEEEVKSTKEDLITAFFSTTSKFNKNQMQSGMAEEATGPEVQHPFNPKHLPLPMAFLNQPKTQYIPSPGGLAQFYQPGLYPELGKAASEPEGVRGPQSSYLLGGTCNSIAASSFLSVSPPADQQERQQGQAGSDSYGRLSPRSRDFDMRSYASSFTLKSSAVSTEVSSVRSKAQAKEYESEKKPEQRDAETGYNPAREKDTCLDYSNTQSPRSLESSNSAASDTMESVTLTRPSTPEEEKTKSEAEEAEVERRKPWKKRKRAIESDQESYVSVDAKVQKVEAKGEDSTSSTASAEATPQTQLDTSTSDLN